MQPTPDARLVPLRDSLVGSVLRGTGNVGYHLRDCIGEGGQGWVFRAGRDDPAGHVVIVKVLRPDVVASEALRRFQREAEVLRMLGAQGRPNPYIVRFYDHATARVPSPYGGAPLTLPFTVLEYVDGTTLEKVLAAHEELGRGLPPGRVRRILRQITNALEMVHAQKVVHRDLKPSNILLANEGDAEIAKVTDFGLVKLVDVSLQKTSALAGASLGYAPPEQYEQGNKRVSVRTDVFSLAAIVYEMLAGRPAFPFIDGENPLLIVTRILTGPRPSLQKAKASLSPELAGKPGIVETLDRELARALAADPNARHASVAELLLAIEPPLTGASEGPRLAARGLSPFEATARASKDESKIVRVVDHSQSAVAFEPTQPVERRSGPVGVQIDPALEAHATNPDAWRWTTLTPPQGQGFVRSVVFGATADSAIGLGPTGLVRWEHRAWTPLPSPPQAAARSVRGVRWLRDGSVLLFGEGGLVARHSLGGATATWRVPDPEITFLGALVEPTGLTTLVGERPYRGTAPRRFPGHTAGVIAQFEGDRITVIGDAGTCARLQGVARLADGRLVACGDWGTLAQLELGVVELVASICAGHLRVIAPLPDGGAVTVGAGGHALSLGPKLEPRLEPVQTTRDIASLALSDGGQAWAGAGQARLLRRSLLNGQRAWVRISGAIGVTSSMIAVTATARSIRAVGDDGAVVEGCLA
jgi:serine/threonine-protein kinase